jgi:MFS family permease
MIYFLRHLLRRDKSVINRALAMLLLISGLFFFGFGMFSPIYALFVEQIGGDITTAANAWALFLLTTGVLTFFTGRWENKIKETELGIVCSQFMVGAAYLVYYFAEGVGMLYLAQILLGIGMALFWPAFHSLYGRHIDGKNAPKQWSFYDGLAYLIPAGAAALGGWLVKLYGFDTIFIIMAVLSFACGLFVLILPRKLL